MEIEGEEIVKIIKPVGLEDIPAIKDISANIYGGRDYLFHIFNRWLNDKNTALFGAFNKDGKLIAFEAVTILGDDAELRALRVDPNLRGKGIAKHMTKFMIDYIKSNFQVVKEISMVTLNSNDASRTLHAKFNFEEVPELRYIMLWEHEDLNKYYTLLSTYYTPDLQEINAEKLFELLNDNSKLMIPNMKIFVVGWAGYPSTLSNLQFLNYEIGLRFYVELNDEGKLIGLLMQGYRYPEFREWNSTILTLNTNVALKFLANHYNKQKEYGLNYSAVFFFPVDSFPSILKTAYPEADKNKTLYYRLKL